jgi:hypothetical protein
MGPEDAVMVVPGIMGSELVDDATGRVLWGVNDPRWYVRVWTSDVSLEALALTEDERLGRYGRIRATRLLTFPAFAPILRGFEPYTKLIKALREAAVNPDAVAEFAYDWRLPVTHNAQLLADAVDQHVRAWRAHPAGGGRETRLVLIAHSMGGLLARQLGLISGATDDVRATLSLGTPFYGAPKAAVMLSRGRGAPLPLPRARLRALAATLPGVYDLLPTYRCVDTGGDARQLSIDDVVAIGGDRDLAEASAYWRERIAEVVPAGHVQVVGAHQPTIQALTISGGVAIGHSYTCRPRIGCGIERVDLSGDGTVPRESAQLPQGPAIPLAQSHGAIARTSEAILIAQDTLADRRTGPWQGAGTIGVHVNDILIADTSYSIGVTGVEHPRHISCQVLDLASHRRVAAPVFRFEDGRIVARTLAPGPGLYRIQISGGGFSAVSQVVMVSEPQDGENARGW